MDIYKKSLKKFKKEVRKNPFINEQEWNDLACKNNYFSSTTLEAHNDVYNFEDLKRETNTLLFLLIK